DNLPGVTESVYSLDGGPNWQTYTGPITFSQDGQYTISYRSTDQAGNMETAKTVSFNVDGTAPTIVVSVPTARSYSDAGDLSPQFTVTDYLSGVDAGKTAVTLDGQALPQGTTIPLYTLNLGTHTFTVSASDRAENKQMVTVTFQTYASPDTLQALIIRFTDNNGIDNKGIADSLKQKLAKGDLQAFLNEVQAQSGKHISEEASTYLLRDGKAVATP
ncbi:MAG: hypothetical protein JWM44_537, partial [Bacilli bacterium]|nr:hypothetical protein [Bacilli bacterium]